MEVWSYVLSCFFQDVIYAKITAFLLLSLTQQKAGIIFDLKGRFLVFLLCLQLQTSSFLFLADHVHAHLLLQLRKDKFFVLEVKGRDTILILFFIIDRGFSDFFQLMVLDHDSYDSFKEFILLSQESYVLVKTLLLKIVLVIDVSDLLLQLGYFLLQVFHLSIVSFGLVEGKVCLLLFLLELELDAQFLWIYGFLRLLKGQQGCSFDVIDYFLVDMDVFALDVSGFKLLYPLQQVGFFILLIFQLSLFLSQLMVKLRCFNNSRSSLKLTLQFFNLIGILLEKRILWIFIDDGLVFDEFSTRGVSESTKCFLEVIISWGAIGQHDCFCIASKRILKESGQFGITVWNMLRSSLNKCADHISQCTQGEIDLLSFFHAISSCSCLAQALTASKIDQVELTCHIFSILRISTG